MESLASTGFEISPQQQYLWLSSSGEERQKLRVTGTILLEGNLDEAVLEKSIQKVIQNNEILRTGFKAIANLNIPVQVIYEGDNFCLNIYDLTNVDVVEQKNRITEIVSELTHNEFDLERGIVFHASLIKLERVKNILAIAISSFCADAISFHNIVGEISKTYQNYLEGKEINNESVQYADLAAWQNELLVAAEAEVGKQYWQNKKLANFAINKLPREKLVDSKSEFISQVINLNISSELLNKIELLAEENCTSVSTILITCWQILLWRLTDRQEIVVANCCSNRNYAELKPVIGLLAKYIPIQIELTENSNLSQILTKLEQEIEEINQWQEYFIATSNNDSFPYAFEFNSQPNKYQNNNLTFTIQNLSTYSDRFKIKLACWDDSNSLTIQLHYDANSFKEEDIQIGLEYQALLESAVNNPKIAIDKLNILSPQERDRLLIEFNKTESLVPPYQCLHHWFEAQVNKTPEATAVIFEDEQLTYQELSDRAENIAQYLISLGVKPETIIALYVERSLDIVIGILGILKAGAAYLPLEPNLPIEALNFRLQDAQVAIILTQKHLAEKIETCVNSTQNKIEIISLDNDLPSTSTPVQTFHETSLQIPTPNNLAYVIYTSGSTGKPKGVAVEHRQIVNYLRGALANLNIPEAAHFALVSTFAADLGKTSIFSALCTGGCLHIISESKSTDPIALADYFSSHKIDCLKIVPSHLSALLTSVNAEKLLPRQRLILGGEAPTWELIDKVHQLVPNCQIFNHYGPTETTVGVLINQIDLVGALREKPLLGNPLTNTQIYILDKHQQLVPIGVPGEIYIGGANVARGYINQPELTTEKFIPNPVGAIRACVAAVGISPLQNPKLYKTGDKARYLPNGKIEFLGRIDRQIKLHGYRIELGEIETVLRQHPQVTDAVVTVRENLNNKYLVAYFIANTEINRELENFLSNKLPEYMLPSHLIQLKAFPLTSNGKIDFNSLPLPEKINTELSVFVAPHNHIETVLTQIWAELLGREKISIHDNFFALGGDSIISIQAIAKANQIGLRLTPKQIFEHQTIAQLATVAEINNSFTSEQGLITGIVPLTPIQHYFFEQNLAEPHHWNQSILLELKQVINLEHLVTAINYLQQHHDVLRAKFNQQNEQWQSEIIESIPTIAITQIDFSHLSENQQKNALSQKATEIQASLNLSSGKLIAIALFNLGTNQAKRLLIAIHHLVIDGVSWRILLEDLQTALTQISQGKTIQLPPKTTSFKQWSKRLHRIAQTESVKTELDYWLSLRSPLNPPLLRGEALPLDFPDGDNTVASAATVSVNLDVEETQALLQEIPAIYHTQVNDILLAALVKAFAEWTGESQLLVDLEGHGREDIFTDVNLSRTIGWFTTIFPVLLDIKETDSNVEIINTIKEQLRQIPNNGISYGLLRYLNKDKTISQALATIPQAEICFNYLGQFDNLLTDSNWVKLASESDGETRSALGKRRYLFNINSYVIDGKLNFDWIYSSQIHQEQTVLNLAEGYIKTLQHFIAISCLEVKSYNASDFPQANLNQEQLNNFLATLD